jgi:DNA-binding HxlR family transcriptional regulator
MLSQRLRTLEEHGVLERRVGPSGPTQVEYHLTDKGRELEPVLEAVIAWSHRWIPLTPPAPSATGTIVTASATATDPVPPSAPSVS